jgi:hypothetical protein
MYWRTSKTASSKNNNPPDDAPDDAPKDPLHVDDIKNARLNI